MSLPSICDVGDACLRIDRVIPANAADGGDALGLAGGPCPCAVLSHLLPRWQARWGGCWLLLCSVARLDLHRLVQPKCSMQC